METREKRDTLLEEIYRQNKQQLQIQNELRAAQFLAPLLVGYPYLPQSVGSIDSQSLVILMNDIVIHGRKSILEFGSGISTVLIGRLIRQNGLNARLISIEHNTEWAETLQENLKNEGLDEFVQVIAAPLEPTAFLPDHTLPWYSTTVLDKELDSERFDMVVVDGPHAYHKEIELARLPAMYYVQDYLTDDFSLFLHDADRPGEQQALREWDQLSGVKHNRFTLKLAGYLPVQRFAISL